MDPASGIERPAAALLPDGSRQTVSGRAAFDARPGRADCHPQVETRMKRLIEWAARLYPRAWRERYGEEFRALIEDVRPGWRELWDVLRGACGMQMRTWELPKFALGFGLIGLVVAGVIAFR